MLFSVELKDDKLIIFLRFISSSIAFSLDSNLAFEYDKEYGKSGGQAQAPTPNFGRSINPNLIQFSKYSVSIEKKKVFNEKTPENLAELSRLKQKLICLPCHARKT